MNPSRGKDPRLKSLRTSFFWLAICGLLAGPQARAQTFIDFPPLEVNGKPEAATVFIDFPELTITGVGESTVFIDFPPLTATGISPPPASFIDFPPLTITGVSPPPTVFIDFPPLVANGLAQLGTPPSGLEILPLPMDPVAGQYLRLDKGSYARDETLKVHYSGLPSQSGAINLFYMGTGKPERSAWYYTSAKTSEGVFERGPNSLPPKTGPWKACIGFGSTATGNSAAPDNSAECLDFVLAGAGSLDAAPVITLSEEPVKAGKAFTLSYSGMPLVNSRIAITPDGTTTPSASHLTNSRSSGSWTLQLSDPGTYEIAVYYTGDAQRARMNLEIQP